MKTKKSTKGQTAAISFRRKLRIYFNYVITFLKVIAAIIIAIAIFTKAFSNIKSYIIENFIEFTADIGFELNHVVISGQKYVTVESILATLRADVGTPILDINIENVKTRLKAFSWVKDAIVKRQLPDKIIIILEEKEPFAVWQYNKEVVVIDRSGNSISDASPDQFSHLIYVVGSDANIYASKLVNELKTAPAILARINSAVRFGERRWNLNLQENITVQMPADNFSEALEYLKKLENANMLFGQKYKNIDLRDSTGHKYYIERYN